MKLNKIKESNIRINLKKFLNQYSSDSGLFLHNDEILFYNYKTYKNANNFYSFRLYRMICDNLQNVEKEYIGEIDFYMLSNNNLHIDKIDIDNELDYRKGYGTILIKIIENYAIDKNANEICGVFSPTYKENANNVEKFYLKNNFEFTKDGIDTIIVKSISNCNNLDCEEFDGIKLYKEKEKIYFVNDNNMF